MTNIVCFCEISFMYSYFLKFLYVVHKILLKNEAIRKEKNLYIKILYKEYILSMVLANFLAN